MQKADRTTEPRAVAALVLGILGLVACPIAANVAAIAFATKAKARFRSDPSLEGHGMAHAGLVLGWVGLAFAVFVWGPIVVTLIRS